MKVSRSTVEQIIAILQEVAASAKVRELCRRHGITETMCYHWRRQYGGSGRARRPLTDRAGVATIMRSGRTAGSQRSLSPRLRPLGLRLDFGY